MGIQSRNFNLVLFPSCLESEFQVRCLGSSEIPVSASERSEVTLESC